MDYVALPKALLHDHLDGGVRVETVIELADASGYSDLPSHDPETLADWFNQDQSGSLEQYLKAFDHTFGVMQTQDAIQRVAYEAGVDLAADGVVYAEVRFGPSLHTFGGLKREDAIEAVLDGFEAARGETGIVELEEGGALRDLAAFLGHELDAHLHDRGLRSREHGRMHRAQFARQDELAFEGSLLERGLEQGSVLDDLVLAASAAEEGGGQREAGQQAESGHGGSSGEKGCRTRADERNGREV